MNHEFQLGEEVTIKVRHNSPLLPSLFPNQPTFKKYTGKVLADRGDDPDTVRITSDDPDVYVRVIYFRSILEVNDQPFTFVEKKAKAKQETKTVQVPGSKGNTYTLTINHDGKVKCSCSGFGFRGRCKHVDQYLEENKG